MLSNSIMIKEPDMPELKSKLLPTELSFKGLFAANTDYEYFLDAEGQPFRFDAVTFQSVNAWWLAEASLLVYVRDQVFVSQKLKKAGLPNTRFFEKKGTQSFVSHNDNFAIVCFRGTEVDEIQDMLDDLDLPLIKNGDRGKVHKGFKKALNRVWSEIEQYIQEITAASDGRMNVWFTGHSLGAALATLAADRYPTAQGVYTFGSPRVGNRRFCQAYQPTVYRFVNNNDMVTMVPPTVGYRHIGLVKYIDDQGYIYDNPKRWVQLKSRIAGHLGHLEDVLQSRKSGDFTAIPVDNLNDHAPIYYAVKVWNSHIKEL